MLSKLPLESLESGIPVCVLVVGGNLNYPIVDSISVKVSVVS